MGLAGILVVILLGALMWFYYPVGSASAPTTQIQQGEKTIQAAADIKAALEARDRQNMDAAQ